MNLLEVLIAKIAPHNCLACGTEGTLLCASCVNLLRAVPERCYLCQRLEPGALTCLDCRSLTHLRCVRVSTLYEGIAKNLIWKLKLAGAQSASRIMSKHMAQLVSPDSRMFIVPVPTATSRVRRRGYDQAKLLACDLARQTGMPYLDCLSRHGQTRQHGLSRHDRLAQLNSAFRLKRQRVIQKANILLVDDVITTGATLEAAAATLSAAGAARIEALVFARPEAKSV